MTRCHNIAFLSLIGPGTQNVLLVYLWFGMEWGKSRASYLKKDVKVCLQVYKLYWRRCWNCPPSLSIHFLHLFIKFPLTRCSCPVLMLTLSRILRFSSYRVPRFVLYTAFSIYPKDRNGRKSFRENEQAINPYSWNTLSISRIKFFRLRTWLADWVNKFWS